MNTNEETSIKLVSDIIFDKLFERQWPNGLAADLEVQRINRQEGWPNAVRGSSDQLVEPSNNIKLTDQELDAAYASAQNRYLNFFEPDRMSWALGQPERTALHAKVPFEVLIWIKKVTAEKADAIRNAVEKEWPAMAGGWKQHEQGLIGRGIGLLPYEDADPGAMLNRVLYALWRANGGYTPVYLQSTMQPVNYTSPHSSDKMTYELMIGNPIAYHSPWAVEINEDGDEEND